MTASSLPPALAIAAVERDTGLSKDTLRIWERRYGFPRPLRDALGERAYPPDQVEKLRLLKRLTDNGHRPGRLVGLDIAELQLLGQAVDANRGAGPALDEPWRGLLLGHDVAGLRRALLQALGSLGLQRFVTEHVARLNVAVGEGWLRGEVSVAQEHVYTEAVQLVLRQGIAGLPDPGPEAPVALLATLPQEPHGLGLLMAEALMSLHGCRCVPLGVRVPLDGIVTAAARVGAGIVALSFSGSFNAAQAVSGLRELRRQLPEEVAIWAGGRNLALQRRLPDGVDAVPEIALVPALLKDRRAARKRPDR